MNRRPAPAQAAPDPRPQRWFIACFGGLLGLALLKFGNPPIMEKWVTAPTNAYELILNPWPLRWAYVLLALLSCAGVFLANWRTAVPSWLIALPAAWLIWQVVAAACSVNTELSGPVLAHFVACVLCFYLAFYCLADKRQIQWLWPGLLLALLIVIFAGWQQHFGGLDQTRRYFFLYIYPNMKEVSPEYLKKISSSRIFSTLFYPNALAGAVLLFLPSALQFVWLARERFTSGARAFLVGTVALGALACLYWSGSKGGWLLMLVLSVLWLLRRPLSPSFKRALIVGLLLCGLAGFFWRYSGFFQKGATSVGARFDYWSAAAQTTLKHPLLGTGPGTFSMAYARVKRPESEMSRLVHNDYLEQASDSGVPGFVLYGTFVIGVLVYTFPWRRSTGPSSSEVSAGKKGVPGPVPTRLDPSSSDSQGERDLWFAIWLGALGLALQSFMEFGLYIPALAWPVFALLGFLLRNRDFEGAV